MMLDQHLDADGALTTWLATRDDDGLLLYLEREGANGAPPTRVDERIVSPAMIAGVFRRYGKPLADDVQVPAAVLHLADGSALAPLRHLARFDVVARDWLVWFPPADTRGEPQAELATSVTAALWHLAHAAL